MRWARGAEQERSTMHEWHGAETVSTGRWADRQSRAWAVGGVRRVKWLRFSVQPDGAG